MPQCGCPAQTAIVAVSAVTQSNNDDAGHDYDEDDHDDDGAILRFQVSGDTHGWLSQPLYAFPMFQSMMQVIDTVAKLQISNNMANGNKVLAGLL